MAYATKYWSEFTSEAGNVYRLEIKEDGFTGASEEVQLDASAVVINQPDASIYDSVVGTGLRFSLISKYPLQYKDLYSNDMLKFKVYLYKNNQQFWIGWLNPDNYSENYSENNTYPVEFLANDGIFVAKNLKYLDGTNTRIRGLEPAESVIMRIMKVIIPDNSYLHHAYDITLLDDVNSDILPDTYETFLHQIVVNNDNYYDELNEPMSMYDVLDSILKPLGLMLRYNVTIDTSLSGLYNNWFLFDHNTLTTTGLIDVKRYDITLNAWDSTYQIDPATITLDLTTDDLYKGTDVQMEYTDVVRKQEIIYSPYLTTDVMDASFDPDDFCGYAECSNFQGEIFYSGNTPTFGEWLYDNNQKFTKYDAGTYFIRKAYYDIAGYTGAAPDDYYVKMPYATGTTADHYISTVLNTNTIFGGYDTTKTDFNKYALVVDFELQIAMVNTVLNRNQINIQFPNFHITFGIKIGTSLTQYFWCRFDEGNYVSGKWYHPVSTKPDDTFYTGRIVKLSQYEYNQLSEGEVTIFVTKSHDIEDKRQPDWEQYIMIKNLKVSLVRDLALDTLTNTVEDIKATDSIIEAYANEDSITDGDSVELKHGTMVENGMIERGAFMYRKNINPGELWAVNKLKKTFIDPVYGVAMLTCEQWLMNKIMSNRSEPMVNITGAKIGTENMKLSLLTRITDTSYLPGVKMYISGFDYNLRDDLLEVGIREVREDNKTILN